MALGNFYEIMEGIIGVPTNDVQSTILYLLSAFLGMCIILMVFSLFGLAGRLLTPK